MTFPSTLKKSGPIAISKTRTGSGSKSSSPGLSGSPVSPLNTSVKMLAPRSSSVKPSAANINLEKDNVMTTVKKVVPVSLKTPASKPVIDIKSESVKTAISGTKVVTKSTTKSPPLKLNLKVIDASGLQKSPVTPKSVPKTPTTPSLKKSMTKSFTVTNSVSAVKSPLVSKIKSPSSPVSKQSNVLTVSSPTTKSQVSIDTKSSVVQTTSKSSPVTKSPKVSVLSKASAPSLPVAKTLTSVVPKTSIISAKVPTSPLPSTKPLSPTVKSVASKTIVKENSLPLTPLVQSKAILVKPTTPVKKAAVLSTKNVVGVKVSTTTSKPSAAPKSSSMVSSMKSILPKVPNSPSKLLNKDPKAIKISNSLTNKATVTSNSGPAVSKVTVNKERTLSSSLPKTLLLKSTSVVPKPTNLKTKVSSSTVPKNLVPKSPITKTLPSTVTIVPSSPTAKKLSPIVNTSTLPAVKTKTPSSPTVRPRTTSISAKPPMSPARPKLLPTKLILSPTKSKLSSSKLNSVSTESLASRKSLKSPVSPKPIKFVPKSPSKVIKKPTQAPIAKAIRGGQPVQKTTVIPETNELPANKVLNHLETSDLCKPENIIKNGSQGAIESTVPGTSNQSPILEMFENVKTEVIIDNGTKTTDTFVYDDVSLNALNAENYIENSVDVQEDNVKTSEEEATVAFSSLAITPEEQKQDENMCSLLDFVVVTKDECQPQLNSISQSSSNILLVENHFSTLTENVVDEHLDEMQSCTEGMEDSFEPMNDKLVLGDAPFETDSCKSEISDSEQATLKEEIEIVPYDDGEQKHSVDNVFVFTNTEDISVNVNDLDRSDSSNNFIHQSISESVERSEGTSSISTDDGSFVSRKSYSEAVVGSPKDGEFDFDYGFDLADDCLDYDDESSVFVEITDKEFPELKPKDCKRRIKKQKKRNLSNGTESLSDSNSISEEINYNPNDFDGNEFSHYIKMMKDCSFYPNGLFCSDSVKLSSSSSLSWLDICVRTTDDLIPSTESLSTYEIFQASNLNKDFLMSVIGCTNALNPPNESSWSWKSIEGKHQSHVKTNITLSLQPRPKHLTTPRFMLLLALISEAKGYEIQPSLSEHFVTTDCMSRFDHKIRRLMVQGFWMVGRLITESLSENEEANCGNPFGFADGDKGYWWAGINMLDWQEYLKECGKGQELSNCYQFVVENNIDGKRHYSREALLSMGANTPEDFMSDSDVENFIHSVRNVKYYCGNCFVESEENLEQAMNEKSCNDDDDLVEWGNGSITQQN